MGYLLAFISVLLLIINNTFAFSSNSSDSHNDSLLSAIYQPQPTEQKVKSYINYIQFLNTSDYELALKYCDTAIVLCQNNKLAELEILVLFEKIRSCLFSGAYLESSDLIFLAEQKVAKLNNSHLKGLLYYIKNLAYIYAADYPKAMDNGHKAIILLKEANDTFALARVYNNIGVIYDNTSDIRNALENYLLSQEYALAIDNKELLSVIDLNIGVIYDKLGDKEKALIYYYKTLEYADLHGDEKAKANAFNNIASLLVDVDRYDEALAIYNKALGLYHNSSLDKAFVFFNMGSLFLNKNNLDSAAYYLDHSLTIYLESNDKTYLAEIYYLMGKLNKAKNNFTIAIQNFNKSIEYSNALGTLVEQERALLELSAIWANQNHFEKAYQLQLKAMFIADSLRKINSNNDIRYSDLQIKFQNQAVEFDKELKNLELRRLSEVKKQFWVRTLFVFIIVFFIILVIIIYRSFVKSIKTNETLVKQNREIEGQKELIEISNLELREQYTFTETLLNTIPNPVFYTDRSGQILGCNQAFEQINGQSIEKMMGLSLTKIPITNSIHCETSKIVDDPENKLLRSELEMVFADGQKHDIICYRKGIVGNDKLLGILGILTDITEIREAERQLNQSQTRLKEALSAKDKFFNIMAHDLKNPFNAVLGLTSIIENNFHEYSESQLKEFITLINDSANQIYSLLENILEWARAQSGAIKVSPSPFFVNEVIQDAINIFSHSIKQKKIIVALNLAKDYEIVSDKNMMMTIFRNLLSNAIKYTLPEGRIEISSAIEDKFIRISIKDNGIGISPENISKLFKLDQPLSTLGVENEKGTGLGLIICQEFIKQNNGTITVESEINMGSTFHVRIPFS